MAIKSFHIPNIMCGHCVNSIKNELEEISGVSRVDGDPDKREITVEYETPDALETIRETLVNMNYPPDD
ncbi:MAG: heavy-metal-associated domain-containing protein [Deltaproteobacteria bacterium]|nr:heavy-metal-associated domain-containing protein [Deltaproteobacteria bacterium]